MNGDLAIAPKPAVVERAPALAKVPSSGARSAPRNPSAELARTGSAAADNPGQLQGDQQEGARLKALITDPNHRLSTQPDAVTGRVVLRVEDRATGELVEQYPAEELLRLYAAMRDSLGGLVDQQA
jgi:flagellar protein FlaG